MSEHYSEEDLADYDAGLLDAAPDQTVRSHLDGCAECRDRLAAVQHVSLVLAAQAHPPMPSDVFARLHRSVLELAATDADKGDLPEDRSAPRVHRDDEDDPATEPRFEPAHAWPSSPAGTSARTSSDNATSAEAIAADKTSAGTSATFGWTRKTMGSLSDPKRPHRRSKALFAVLATCALAAVVGLGGYVLSGVSGHNEPIAGDPVVLNNGESFGSNSELQDRSGLSPHRFSEAWSCARQVTSGRITGIRASVLNGRSGFVVFLDAAGGGTRVVFVSGCGTDDPEAGPSATLPKG